MNDAKLRKDLPPKVMKFKEWMSAHNLWDEAVEKCNTGRCEKITTEHCVELNLCRLCGAKYARRYREIRRKDRENWTNWHRKRQKKSEVQDSDNILFFHPVLPQKNQGGAILNEKN